MTKRNMIVVIVVMVLAMLATASVTLAKNPKPHKITGQSYFLVEDWGAEIWNTVLVNKNPLTHELKGKITVKITSSWVPGVERKYETTPVCVKFYEDKNRTPWAIVVHRITADGVSGFGPGLPFEYAKWKIHDTQAPDGQGDTVYLAYECYDSDPNATTCDTDRDGVGDAAYSEFWPADRKPPSCNDKDFIDYPLELDGGDLVIH
jgi:hypothetical protein